MGLKKSEALHPAGRRSGHLPFGTRNTCGIIPESLDLDMRMGANLMRLDSNFPDSDSVVLLDRGQCKFCAKLSE